MIIFLLWTTARFMINASHLSSIFFLATRKPQTCNMQANYASSSGTLDLHLAYFDQCCRSSHNSSHKFYPSSPSPSTTGESFPKVLASILCRTRECTGHGMWPGLPAPLQREWNCKNQLGRVNCQFRSTLCKCEV